MGYRAVLVVWSSSNNMQIQTFLQNELHLACELRLGWVIIIILAYYKSDMLIITLDFLSCIF